MFMYYVWNVLVRSTKLIIYNMHAHKHTRPIQNWSWIWNSILSAGRANKWEKGQQSQRQQIKLSNTWVHEHEIQNEDALACNDSRNLMKTCSCLMQRQSTENREESTLITTYLCKQCIHWTCSWFNHEKNRTKSSTDLIFLHLRSKSREQI